MARRAWTGEPMDDFLTRLDRESEKIMRRVAENNARIAALIERVNGGPRFIDGGGI